MEFLNNPPELQCRDSLPALYDYVHKLNELLNVVLPNLEPAKLKEIEARLTAIEKGVG